MILVDSNVFVIDLRYRRDRLYRRNRVFLEELAELGSGATTIVNLLEVAGILSFNLSPRQTRDLITFLPRRYRIAVVPAVDLDGDLPGPRLGPLVERISARCSFGDALVIETALALAPGATHLVTWDARHFAGTLPFEVVTPTEMTRRWSR